MVSRIHAIVSGHVQGVGFRYYAREKAIELGVAGFARNLVDGTVEIEAEATDASLATFEAWLDDGPPAASVSSVITKHIEPTGGTGFEVAR